MYTTHGYMTPADMQDYRELYDLDAWKDEINPDCPGHYPNKPLKILNHCTLRDECWGDED